MDDFKDACESAYAFIHQQQHTTSKEVRRIGHFKYHEWGDILFHLRIHYGVVSISGKGVFIDDLCYQQWLKGFSKVKKTK